MRTQEEVAERFETSTSMFGFEKEVWISYLDYAHAKPFLKGEVTEEDWSKDVKALDEPTVLADMRSYAAFGWEKIIDHRGLSAGRTVEKMCAWLWLLGTPQADELIKFAEDEANYPQYGAPILSRICETYGFPVPTDAEVSRMQQGLPCHDGCEGCGG